MCVQECLYVNVCPSVHVIVYLYEQGAREGAGDESACERARESARERVIKIDRDRQTDRGVY